MTLRDVLREIMSGLGYGIVAVFVMLVVVGTLMRGCVTIIEAQTIDVRIDENDRTLRGLNFPESSNSLLGDYLLIKIHHDHSVIIEVPPTEAELDSLISCLDYNAEIYRQATEAGQTGLELRAPYNAMLKDC